MQATIKFQNNKRPAQIWGILAIFMRRSPAFNIRADLRSECPQKYINRNKYVWTCIFKFNCLLLSSLSRRRTAFPIRIKMRMYNYNPNSASPTSTPDSVNEDGREKSASIEERKSPRTHESASVYIRRKSRERRDRNCTIALTEEAWQRSLFF